MPKWLKIKWYIEWIYYRVRHCLHNTVYKFTWEEWKYVSYDVYALKQQMDLEAGLKPHEKHSLRQALLDGLWGVEKGDDFNGHNS